MATGGRWQWEGAYGADALSDAEDEGATYSDVWYHSQLADGGLGAESVDATV